MIHHRLPTDSLALAGLAPAFLGAMAGPLSETDWQRLLGPLGGYVLSILMLLYFIMRDRAQTRERKKSEDEARDERQAESKARDERHRETIALQKENSAAILAITVRAVESEGKIANALENLTRELENRPCGKSQP